MAFVWLFAGIVIGMVFGVIIGIEWVESKTDDGGPE